MANTSNSNNNNNRNNLNIDLSNADNNALMSQFSSFLTSPNALSFFNPMQSPLNPVFSSAFQSFPAVTTPPILNNNGGDNSKAAALNNLSNLNFQFMNTPTDNLFTSQPPLTPSTLLYLPTPMVQSSDQLSHHFERQLQDALNMNMSMNQLASIYDIGNTHTTNTGSNNPEVTPIATHSQSAARMHEHGDDVSSKLQESKFATDEGLVCESRRGRKRKIKQENEDDEDDDDDDDEYFEPTPAPKKRRGRKKKRSSSSDAQKDDLQLLSEKMQEKTEKLFSADRDNAINTFVGIRSENGSVEIPLPAHIEVEYEVFGNVCTDKIEDILQAKGRTRYVRGLSEQEKKDRRREQNRNAAARSRARKNAMISKVIQLHQENIGLRSYVAGNISKLNSLRDEV
eukprot:CAMPEP_0202701902 /NCGR_PEP_ID=MMETSP1385-20130828/14938_1 /ASSEMBLY_ACC=CAM_ASM_000861 /TAXON_ID=933848 /ORGANISM="Elphidium margaritaceum" /LENGTH=397 /DNA_ID=CAMNT_0049359419 /DNA_START=144 /DNA_END=1333 /DNA_ORIENTATION=-